MILRLCLTTTLAFGLAACGDDDEPTDVGDTTQTDATDTSAETDTAPDAADTTEPDTVADAADVTDVADITDTTDAADTSDTADVDPGEVVANEWGFPIRKPANHEIACDSEFFDKIDAMDADWLCTFVQGGVTATVYTQSTPTDCEVTLSGYPSFGVNSGWLAQDGQALATLGAVSYDWGGNHHNDSLSFTWNGKGYRYYHSSFGFGFRSCQEMDCLQVRDSGGTLIEDGCGPTRSLPIVCQPIAADGTWQALVDQFERCNGDPNSEPTP